MKNLSRWLAAFAAAFLFAAAAHAAADPFLGTWRLDKAKSTIANDPGVKMKEFVFSRNKGGGVMITETLEMLSGGEKHVSHLPYVYGKPTPQAGPGFDALLVEKTGPRAVRWTVTLKGKILSQLAVAISADGKEMAFRYLSAASDPTGAVTKDRYVYVKQ
jgi:hypothetical protein